MYKKHTKNFSTTPWSVSTWKNIYQSLVSRNKKFKEQLKRILPTKACTCKFTESNGGYFAVAETIDIAALRLEINISAQSGMHW